MTPALIILIFTLCSFNADAAIKIPTDQVEIQEGRRIYIITCTKCHNTNPHKPGGIGPDLYSTPNEVFQSKIPSGTYPKGYTPKRRTRVMPKFKNLTNKIDAIYKYIRSIPK
jgi:mono/diheme cytochrome c family protein